MRILFSAPPDHGHTMPLLPLVRAASEAGHIVGFLTSAHMRHVVEDAEPVGAQPSFAVLREETGRRLAARSSPPGSGMRSIGGGLTPDMLAELFVDVRISLGGAAAISDAAAFRPDLIIADELDYIGPLVAASLDLPLTVHAFGLRPQPAFEEALANRFAPHLSRLHLTSPDRLARVDIWPEALRPETQERESIDIAMRPFDVPDVFGARPDVEHRPTVIVTLGTTVADPGVLGGVVESVLGAGVDVIATAISPNAREMLPRHQNLRVVPFTPLPKLLSAGDAVVSAAGAGTVLAILGRGLPSVLMPQVAEQPLNAEQARRVGAAVVVSTPGETGEAVRRVLRDGAYRRASRTIARHLGTMPSPPSVLPLLLERAVR